MIWILTLWQDEVDCNENESVRPGDVLIETDFRPDNDGAGNAGLITVTRVKREHALPSQLACRALLTRDPYLVASPDITTSRISLKIVLVVLYKLHENIH